MEEYVKLNTQKSSIEKDHITQEENQKIKNKCYRELKQYESSYILDEITIVNDKE
jgi:hypothetical protein